MPQITFGKLRKKIVTVWIQQFELFPLGRRHYMIIIVAYDMRIDANRTQNFSVEVSVVGNVTYVQDTERAAVLCGEHSQPFKMVGSVLYSFHECNLTFRICRSRSLAKIAVLR